MRKVLLPLICFALISFSSVAQKPVALSMEDCINYALKNNISVKNAQIDVLIQEAVVKQTTAAALPSVNGKGDVVHFSDKHKQFSFFDSKAFNPLSTDGIQPVPFTIPYTSSASITASQVLFDGSVMVALQARNTVLQMARENKAATAEEVRYNVYKSYNSLVIAYKQFDIIVNSLKLAREMEQDLIKTREAGMVEKIEVDRTSVQVNNLATDSIKVSNMLTVAEQVLKYQMGMDINAKIVLIDTNVENGMNSVLMLADEKENYDRVPQYSVLKTALRLNEYDLKRYRLAALPTLSGFISRGVNYGGANVEDVVKFGDYIEYYNGGISLSVPIFNGFARQSQVRQAKLNIEKTKNNIENFKQTIDFQAAQARTSLKNSMLQVQSQKRNMELSESVLDLAQRKYKAGVGSNLEVTTAQTEMLRAQNNYFTALLDVINAEADLKKALGLLNK